MLYVPCVLFVIILSLGSRPLPRPPFILILYPGLFQSAGIAFVLYLFEEIVAFVINKDKRREVLDLDFPDGLHAEFWIFEQFHLLDGVLSQDGRRSAYRAKVETTVVFARVVTCWLRFPLAIIIIEPPAFWNWSTYGSIRPAVVGPKDPDAIPAGVLAGPA